MRFWNHAELAEARNCAQTVGGSLRAAYGLPRHHPDERYYVAGETRPDGTRGTWVRGTDGQPVLA